jgi:hypothetical protein
MSTWWSGTPNSYYGDRFTPSKFDVQGIVPIADALFAVGLGLAAAAVLRRTLPALAVPVGGFLAVRLVVSNWMRPHFQVARVLNVPADQKVPTPSGSWVLHQDFVLHGRVVNGSLAAPVQCVGQIDRGNGPECLASLGYRYVVRYQPADRYWTFQAYEAAIFLALAIGLVLIAWLVTRRRDA